MIKFYTVPETIKILRCGRTNFYTLVKKGEIKPVKMGGKVIVTEAEINRFLSSLPAWTSEPKGGAEPSDIHSPAVDNSAKSP